MTFEINEEVPLFLRSYLETEPLKRIQKIDMNCGMNYTSFPLFRDLDPYSRYTHSLETAKIIYYFTHDKKQTIAGLLHDIATPVFSHVVDFMNQDHMNQEFTEDLTEMIIRKSDEIMNLLQKDGILLHEVCNYHIYPIADNDLPKLSADRLQYTLGNIRNYGFASNEEIQKLFDAIMVAFNEYGEKELVFRGRTEASQFALLALKCGMIYTCSEDRYGMEVLARLLKRATERNILTYDDLYTDEENVIAILLKSEMKDAWVRFTNMHQLKKSDTEKDGYMRVHAKKRYIDPYVLNEGRVSEIDETFRQELKKFLDDDQNEYMAGE